MSDEQSPKRQKIEDEASIAFWKWYLPHSAHPKKSQAEMKDSAFRNPVVAKLYRTLVRRKWHQRWYFIDVLKVHPYQMYTFEVLRSQGAFRTEKPTIPPRPLPEYWEQ